MALSCKFVGLQCLGLNQSRSKKLENPECYVTGEGLKSANLHQPAKFFLHTLSPDLLFLDLDVTRIVTNRSLETTTTDTTVEFECLDENIHSVVYLPQKAGDYQVTIRWKGRHVTGSPFNIKVVDVPTIIVPQSKSNDHREEVWKLRDNYKQKVESNLM